MASDGDPNAWLGLLKWSLAHQDGTEPSDARPMADEDRAWLEKVVSEGVRDDFAAMTNIYMRLCAYLDRAATRTSTTATANPSAPMGETAPIAPPATTPSGSASLPTPPPAIPQASSGSGTVSIGGALSTFVAPPVVAVPAEVTYEGGVVGDGGMDGEEGVDGIMNDLEELQDIVEHIDMAATFAKIGGFGRLIALVAPPNRPEKLRLRAASVIATLTKNNPPAQAAFSSSRGHRALLQATQQDNALPSQEGARSAPPLSFALQRAILHALSCSVMGLAAGEDALCSEPGFQHFLASCLSQRETRLEAGEGWEDQNLRLRAKAAFVLKALIGAPGANAERVAALRPAVSGLLEALEAVSSEASDEESTHLSATRETCIEALLASAKSADGTRVVRELGPRVSAVMAKRRQALTGEGSERSEEDAESAEFELDLWLQWERLSFQLEELTGPAQ